jgi:uncharacterized membrane protein
MSSPDAEEQVVTGPVQLLVVGFESPDFRGEVLDRLRSLREHDLVRVIDILLAYKDADGVLETRQITDLSEQEAGELGDLAAALVGLGAALGGADGEQAAALWTADTALAEEDLVDVLAEIPPDTAVAIALLEHRWAVPLRDAILRAGGFPILDTWVHPRDLVEIGVLAAAQAEAALGG